MLLSGQKRSRGSAALAAESRRALDSNSQRVSGSYNHPEGVAAAFIGRFGEAQPMAMGRPKTALVLDTELREQLESLANSRSLPAGLVRRAKIILLSASGKTNREVARQLRDRDKIFGNDFRKQVRDMGICEVLSAPRSPWQRAYVDSSRVSRSCDRPP